MEPLVVGFCDAEVIEADLNAIVVAHAANAPLGQLWSGPMLEVLDCDGLAAWHNLAEFARPEVTNSELGLQKRGDGVASAVRVRRCANVGPKDRQHTPLRVQDDSARSQVLARYAHLLRSEEHTSELQSRFG